MSVSVSARMETIDFGRGPVACVQGMVSDAESNTVTPFKIPVHHLPPLVAKLSEFITHNAKLSGPSG